MSGPAPVAAKLPLLLTLPLAVATGLAIPLQGRINGALGAELQDGLAAALVSFGSGLVMMVLLCLVLPQGRSGLRALRPALRGDGLPRWYLFAGCLGAFMVFSQGLTVPLTGIALFTVATVAGTSVSALLVDRLGLGPAGRKRVTAMRLAGALLTVAGVVWAVSPKFVADVPVAHWLLPVLLPLAAGFMRSFQQAINAAQAVQFGSPLAATLVNFAVGSAVLLAAWLVKVAVAGPANPLPEQWWYYLGGPMGTVFVTVANVLVRNLGVLLSGLAMIAGQLLGSLALDVAFPAAGSVVTAATVAGTLLTLAAMILATLPWPRPGLRRRSGPARDPSAAGSGARGGSTLP
ncbi:DMT family transporter [Arthrobacter mobilis]|uniref:DMT family transporter n=1 Tax=Arthrobacter mobilis TaxID=2724944 RepID=A0A7X6K7X9_9MICC|nr:DMT family transporter [Arthrobacter mobilis]NKX56774.1 DMT family transporter [Arthrobacter mobilis]